MRKIFSLLLAGLIIISFAIPVLAFSDVSTSSKNYLEINWLSQNSVIKGYPDGTFKPDATVNRAEFLKIVFLALGLSGEVAKARTEITQKTVGFPDVSIEQWYAPYVYLAKKRGSIRGYIDATFRPGNPIKRSEAFKIVLSEFYNNQIDFSGTGEVADVPAGEWFWKYANFAAERDLFDGSVFHGGLEMTRGSVAELVYRTKAVKDNSATLYSAALTPHPVENIVTIEGPPVYPHPEGTVYILTPETNTVLDANNDIVLLSWTTVDGAASYRVQIENYDETKQSWVQIDSYLNEHTWSDNIIAKKIGRYRFRVAPAFGYSYREGPFSEYHYYSRAEELPDPEVAILATAPATSPAPRILTPSNNATFTEADHPIWYTWTLTEGVQMYNYYFDYFDSAKNSWVPMRDSPYEGDHDCLCTSATPFNDIVLNKIGLFRFRVRAKLSGGNYSDFSDYVTVYYRP